MPNFHIDDLKELRLLPLISSATEIVHALGLGRFQVGRSHECDYPPCVSSLPVCTKPAIPVSGSSAEIDTLVKERVARAISVYEVDAELIAKLRPSHIFTQTQCEVCAVSLDDVEQAFRNRIATDARVIVLEPYSLEHVWRDIERVAEACRCEGSGGELIAKLRRRMSAIEARCKPGKRRRVAALEWLEPLMAAGNWVPELIEMARGENLFGAPGGHSPRLTWDELVVSDPDILIALPCGFDLARTESEMNWLTEKSQWPELRAVRSGRVFVCDGNQFMNRPGPRLVDSLQVLAEILHPGLFEPILEGIGWRRFG